MIVICKCGLRIPIKAQHFPLRCSCGAVWISPADDMVVKIDDHTAVEIAGYIEKYCEAGCRMWRGDMCTLDIGCKQAGNPDAWRHRAQLGLYTCALEKWTLDELAVPAIPDPQECDILDDVTICVTAYQRPDSLQRLRRSLSVYYPRVAVDVEDTGGNLSAGRNRLVNRCETPFTLIVEDDMEFLDDGAITRLLSVLHENESVGVACGVLMERDELKSYAYDLRLFRQTLWREPSLDAWRETTDGILYRYVDLSWNFFLARTEVLRDLPWDERLELHEHAAWFWSLKQQGKWRVATVPSARIAHHQDRPSEEYIQARQRTKLFIPILRQHYRFESIKELTPPQQRLTLSGRRFTTDELRAAAREAAIDFAREFPETFPICGTLLGMIRDGDVIAWDKDIDFGCVEWPDGIERSRTFVLLARYHDKGQLCEIVFRHPNGTKLDLFLFFRTGDMRQFVVYGDEFPTRPTIRQSFPTEHFAFETRSVWGRNFRMFCDPEAWLEANYGPYWRVPDRTFTYKPKDTDDG